MNAIDIYKMREIETDIDYVVIGLGKTGFASAKYLAKNNCQFVVMDNRENPPYLQLMREQIPECEVILGDFDTNILLHAKQIILSPGISLDEPAIKVALENHISIISDIELFVKQVSAPILAVTGSNGKSTVVTLLAKVLEDVGMNVCLGGNIGTPVLDLMEYDEADVYVLELSSFQLETTYSLNAKAAVVLNISEDHMDRYFDLKHYADTKLNIYNGDGLAVFNRDEPQAILSEFSERKIISIGSDKPDGQNYGLVEKHGRVSLVQADNHLVYADELKIKGIHNALNILAVLALLDEFDIDRNSVINTIKAFPGLEHRCEWVSNINNVDWYNDSKGTNVGATLAAANGLTDHQNLILIVGGVGKDADFSPLKTLTNKIKLLIVFGQDGLQIANVFSDCLDIQMANDLKHCVDIAYQAATANDVVLFSPACASFDMFKNYEDRGDTFKSLVGKLQGHDI